MTGMRFTLSVDDGHPLDLRVAELLDRHRVQATFYVPVTNAEGPPVMQPTQLRELAARFEIGSHTRSHRFLASLDDARARAEIVDGRRMLEDWLGQPVAGFCYPGGRYRDRHRQMVRDAGFAYARTTQNLRTDAGDDPYAMPTTLQFYPHPAAVLARNFLSQGNRRRRLRALVCALGCSDWQRRLHRLLALAARRQQSFHLWLHALDLERLDLWQAFDRFLAEVAAQVPLPQRLTNAGLLSCPPAAPLPVATAATDRDGSPPLPHH